MGMLLYSGSSAKFDKFDLAYVGTGSGTTGAGYGIYMSESKADALGYGDIVYECFVDLWGNNLSNTKITLKPELVVAIIERLNEKYNKDYWANYSLENPTHKDKVVCVRENLFSSFNKSDTDIIGDIINSEFGGKCKSVLETLVEFDYTHTTDNKTPEDNTITHYILFDVDSISILNVEDFTPK